MPYKSYSILKGNFIPILSFAIGIVLLVSLIFFISPAIIFESLKKITLWQFGLIFALKLVFSVIGALKWKVILDFYKQKVALWKLYLFKFAAFSVSYFTPIAAVGGQVVGVMLLKSEKVPTKIGITTMLIDSILTPFLSVTISFFAVVLFLLTKFSNTLLIFASLTLFSIVVFLILFFFVFRIKRLNIKKIQPNFWLRWRITIKDFLFLFSDFFRKNKKGAFNLIVLSLLGHVAVLFEIFLILYFLGAVLEVIELAIIEAGYTFAFITPISQALGTAEISGAYFLHLLGYTAALGVSLTLILRLRYLLIGLIGIVVLVFYGLIKIHKPGLLSLKSKIFKLSY